MEILKRCSVVTCPMHALFCNYALDFNPKYDKLRSKWEKARRSAKTVKDERALRGADRQFLPLIHKVLMTDINAGAVKCKADFEVPLNDNLSLDQIATTFGLTRTRVQQLEMKAKEKIAVERKEFEDFIGAVKSEGA